MLYPETVEGKAFELLKALMQDKELANFYLVGGTALSLYLGHRKSIDLDLFTPFPFDVEALEANFLKKYNFERNVHFFKNSLSGMLDGVKVDCITYDYPIVGEPIITKDGIRLIGMQDIAAMKLSAICQDGSRLKDFVDVACLSAKYSLNDMIQTYHVKYKHVNPVSPLKALIYFDDIKFNEKIEMINGSFEWKKVEKRLYNMVKNDNTVFASFPMKEESRKTGRSSL